jgi:hypothetical protein
MLLLSPPDAAMAFSASMFPFVLLAPGSSSSENVVKLYDQMLGKISGLMPPPRSRIRMVTPGIGEEDPSSP